MHYANTSPWIKIGIILAIILSTASLILVLQGFDGVQNLQGKMMTQQSSVSVSTNRTEGPCADVGVATMTDAQKKACFDWMSTH